MNRRTLLNLGLLLLVIVLGLITLFEPGKQPPPEPDTLTSLQGKDIQKISIDRHDAESIVLERMAGGWNMTHPVTAAVSSYRINSILKLASTRSLGSHDVAGKELKDFGLEKPRLHVTLNGDLTLSFGSNTPLDQRRYLLLDNTIHLINDSFYYQLIGDFTTFIDTSLLPGDTQITGIKLPNLVVTQVDGQWQAQPEPESYSADQAALLVEAWRHASALEIKAHEGTEGEQLTLYIKGKSEPIHFMIIARSPELVLARPDLGIKYHLAEHYATELLTLNKPVSEEPE